MNSTVTSNSSIENSVSKRYYDSSWDYKDANTKIVSHGIHTYPAMMIPQIARRLIEIYGNTADVLFHIFKRLLINILLGFISLWLIPIFSKYANISII